MKKSDGGGKILQTFFFISEHGVLLTTSLADSPCQSLDENRPFFKNLILQYTASTLLGDHRNFKVIEKPARPDLVLKCQMLCWLSGQTFRGSKHKRRQSIFYDIRQIVFRKACKLTPNSWESFSRIFYQASQMCWLSLWSEIIPKRVQDMKLSRW